MIELLMAYCLAGEPCVTETLAIFPQEDVGDTLCEIARPSLTDAIRGKARPGAVITLSCVGRTSSVQRKDQRYHMLDAAKGETVLDIIKRLIK